jgi:hypothetical protein
VDCHQARSVACVTRDAEPDEEDLARAQVDRMRTDGVCAAIKAEAYNQIPYVQVWEDTVRILDGDKLKVLLGDIRHEPVSPGSAQTVKRIDIWLNELNLDGATLGHETMHVLGYTHREGEEDYFTFPDGVRRSFDATAKYCAGSR